MHRNRMSRLRAEHVVGLVLVVLAAVTMVLAVSANARIERATHCQTTFNAEYRRVLEQRTDAAQRERDAQRKLIVAVGTDSETQPALDEYLRALDDADKHRAENPLPTLNQC